MKHLILACAFLGLTTGSVIAQDTTPVVMDPGLYNFTETMSVNGHLIHEEAPYDYCLTAEMVTTSLEELSAKLVEDGDCTISNETHTSTSGSADMTCRDENFGIEINGTINGTFTRSSYDVVATATTPLGLMTSKTKAVLKGACPPNWTPPPNISRN